MKYVGILIRFIQIDTRTAISILSLGNFALTTLILGYYISHRDIRLNKQLCEFGCAKFIQALAWFCSFLVYELPIWLVGILGNNLLFIGMYLEAIIMLSMVNQEKGKVRKILNAILIVTIFSFDYAVLIGAKSSIRVTLSSLGVFLILIIPTVLYIINKRTSTFKRAIGIIYILFLSTLPFRAFVSLKNPNMNLFTNNLIQNVNFLSLILMLVVGGAGFLLLFKEEADLEIRKLATLDPLTLIPNRRYFMSQAKKIFELHKRTKKSLSMIFIDVDYFKRVNDTYGHSFGDEVLKSLAEVIQNQVRAEDCHCRYGGEEFLILLTDTNKEKSELFCKRIQKQIELIKIEGKPEFTFTVSLGIFSKNVQIEDKIEEFIEKSDKALYKAKLNGRNCIQFYS